MSGSKHTDYRFLYKKLQDMLGSNPSEPKTFSDIDTVKTVQSSSTTQTPKKAPFATQLRSSVYAAREHDYNVTPDDSLTSSATENKALATKFRSLVNHTRDTDYGVSQDPVTPSANSIYIPNENTDYMVKNTHDAENNIASTSTRVTKKQTVTPLNEDTKYTQASPKSEGNWLVVAMCLTTKSLNY